MLKVHILYYFITSVSLLLAQSVTVSGYATWNLSLGLKLHIFEYVYTTEKKRRRKQWNHSEKSVQENMGKVLKVS